MISNNRIDQFSKSIIHKRSSNSLHSCDASMIVDKNILWDEMFSHKNYTKFPKENPPKERFYHAIGPILAIGHIFGIMPVSGSLDEDISYLRFSWKTWRMAHCALMMAGGALLSFLSFLYMVFHGFNVDNAGMLVFYGSAFLVQILFLRLAHHWPTLNREIARVESLDDSTVCSARFLQTSFTLRTKFCCCSFIVLSFAFVEHALCVLSGIAVAYNCYVSTPIIETHYTSAFPQVFTLTPYAHWKAFFLQVVNLAATFAWNFMDLFIILMGLAFEDMFQQLNKSLKMTVGKVYPRKFWGDARNVYAEMSHLIKKVDCAINEIIFLSFTQNLYIICKQLFNSVKSGQDNDQNLCWTDKNGLLGGLASTIYFSFSFGFLVVRFLTVALNAASVYHASRQPLSSLYQVSPKCYTLEVQRFLDQVISDCVALTGLNFFYITKSLILTIAGTVVTYELVLVQFYMPRHDQLLIETVFVFNNTCEPLTNISYSS